MLVKFEQNQIIQTTSNLELFDKKLFTMLTISDISLAPFGKRFLKMKQLNDAELCIKRLTAFIYSKIYGSLTRVTRIKFAVNTSDPTYLFGDSSYP